ncbi:MAG: protein-glutamate O-methyltransferase CheR [Deltaproteobacteria bacterium]|jgi:chemotaxis protein methyltransferase CheR|nr:protein-glutamate O-methyltransferase CheR [Deltaproteobacteria bacterium]
MLVPNAANPELLAARDWISTHLGIHFPNEKLDILSSRLSSVVAKRGTPSVEVLMQEVHAGTPQARLDLAQAVSTNHTFFFREQPTLDFFKKEIVAKTPNTAPMRIWSAASSSGEEAYTIAMIVSGIRGTTSLAPNVAILGTDISQRALAAAEAGEYDLSALERVPGDLRQRCIETVGPKRGKIVEGLRQACVFRRMNLATPQWPLKGGFNVVFCRNILYYFESRTQAAVVNHIYDLVVPGGWLITSVSETVRNLDTKWLPIEPGVYRRAP